MLSAWLAFCSNWPSWLFWLCSSTDLAEGGRIVRGLGDRQAARNLGLQVRLLGIELLQLGSGCRS